MNQNTVNKNPKRIQAMFSGIAHRYNVMNRLMTFGNDIKWRKRVIKLAAVPSKGALLDIGTGTGDLAIEARHQNKDSKVIGADFTMEMMLVGKERTNSQGVNWAASDALFLPFNDLIFDAVVSGFLLRNVIDLPEAIREQHRVLKSGGKIISVDTTQPRSNLLSPIVRFYLRTIIPALGKLVAGKVDAYEYLPNSTEGFLTAEALQSLLDDVGFEHTGFKTFMFGTIAIHWGMKSQKEEIG